ncbi:MGH1-like glycoside hydrolase domain-containing protein [Hymenobacter pini]|uniref:MGH1-like glycoside hydrolase domain-containing protein n=1 Tax=Hymenobacter pini TaxID=2880879 RepID=UPI001CF484CB|nr:glycogen debranching protein [Hymenobacter pini]MCA8829893.1 glycogen debranching protein [Hymenobacter pini]
MSYSAPALGGLLALALLSACQTPKPAAPVKSAAVPASPLPAEAPLIWKNEAYALYADRVEQGPYVGRAVSRTELTSNYQSPANAYQDPRITFKFSLNGADNEMAPGRDHSIVALPRAGSTALETPVLTFGQQFVDKTEVSANTYLAPNTPLTIRLDMRPVLAAFKKQGYFTTYAGEKLYAQDFKGVFVAGNTAPLSWDFANLAGKQELELKDPDGNGIYEVTLVLNQPKAAKSTAGRWQQTLNTADFPQYRSDYPLTDALYNLALEEARRAVEPDSTFRTGQEWAGVWTRDISYSIILAQATLQPKVAMNSLLRKVSANGRIIQDTGTGGAYPCSTDRMIWAVAAWEIYLVTGDEAWLRKVYPIIKRSIEDDQQNAYDPNSTLLWRNPSYLKPEDIPSFYPQGSLTFLVRGESSFLDWREQTYPRWMQPVDIYQSENLGTNAVHYQANVVLAKMAERLGQQEVAQFHSATAVHIKSGINYTLWTDHGYYGQYRYGRNYLTLSPKAETLGEALCVLFGVAEEARAQSVVQNTPTTAFGTPCIYPQIPGIPPYHNNAVWPFVQSFWALAGAEVGNEASVLESMAAVYRPAALFLTNKENFVADNGDFAGTQINSSNMLWSLSGSLALVYKVLFGMRFAPEGLVLRPFVPQALQGRRELTGFRYRGAVLDIELQGFGNEISTITLDGQPLPNATIPTTLTGRHTVRITLKNQALFSVGPNHVPNRFAPETPTVRYTAGRLSWAPVAGASAYQVLRNGRFAARTTETSVAVMPATYAEYQVVAVDGQGLESFASEPLVVAARPAQLVQLESSAPKSGKPYKGFSGAGFVEISKTVNTRLAIPVTVAETGLYALDFRYANGNGPLNTDNKCAIRTLRLSRQPLGTVVLPQRGVAEWSNWGFTNPVLVQLAKGQHTLTLSFESANENMNGEVNQAMLDYLRITRVE